MDAHPDPGVGYRVLGVGFTAWAAQMLPSLVIARELQVIQSESSLCELHRVRISHETRASVQLLGKLQPQLDLARLVRPHRCNEESGQGPPAFDIDRLHAWNELAQLVHLHRVYVRSEEVVEGVACNVKEAPVERFACALLEKVNALEVLPLVCAGHTEEIQRPDSHVIGVRRVGGGDRLLGQHPRRREIKVEQENPGETDVSESQLATGPSRLQRLESQFVFGASAS